MMLAEAEADGRFRVPNYRTPMGCTKVAHTNIDSCPLDPRVSFICKAYAYLCFSIFI